MSRPSTRLSTSSLDSFSVVSDESDFAIVPSLPNGPDDTTLLSTSSTVRDDDTGLEVHGERTVPSPDTLPETENDQVQHGGEVEMQGGTVTLLIENRVFQVDRFFLQRDSEPFRTLFMSTENTENDGSSVERAIILGGTRALDFKRFMNLLYPVNFTTPVYSTVEEWTSVLCVAHAWEFESIRALAIQSLSALASSVDKIALGHFFNEPGWLLDAYVDLCTRREVLSVTDAERLGLPNVMNIWTAREALIQNTEMSKCDVVSTVRRICCPYVPIASGEPNIHRMQTERNHMIPVVQYSSQQTRADAETQFMNSGEAMMGQKMQEGLPVPEELHFLRSKVEQLSASIVRHEEERYYLQDELKAAQSELIRTDTAWATKYDETIQHMRDEIERYKIELILASAEVTDNVTQILLSTLEEIRRMACDKLATANNEKQRWGNAVAGRGLAEGMELSELEQRKRTANKRQEEAQMTMSALDELNTMITERLV